MGNNLLTKYMKLKDPTTEKEDQTKCKQYKDLFSTLLRQKKILFYKVDLNWKVQGKM